MCLLRSTDCLFIYMYNSGQYTTLHRDCWAQKLYVDVSNLFDLAKYKVALNSQNTLQETPIISDHGITSYHKTPTGYVN